MTLRIENNPITKDLWSKDKTTFLCFLFHLEKTYVTLRAMDEIENSILCKQEKNICST